MNKKYKNQIILKGVDRTSDVQKYELIDDNKLKVIFKDGTEYNFGPKNYQIIESILNTSKNGKVFDYMKRIAEETGIKIKPDNGIEFNSLSYQYKKIDYIEPGSLLASYLNADFSQLSCRESKIILDTIYPFGFNSSQKDAIDKALRNQLSVIEGPPGTGKTQTILNIIANILLRGESIAIVSSNNSATKNVFDKLQRYDIDFIAASLGNSSNKEEFIRSQKPLPDMSAWRMSSKEIGEMKISLRKKHQELNEKLNEKQKMHSLKQELFNLDIEQKHFIRHSEKIKLGKIPKEILKINTSYKALSFWLLCEFYGSSRPKPGVIEYVKHVF